jgi:hypothetical protein
MRILAVMPELVRIAPSVQHVQHLRVPDLQYQQGQQRRHGGDQQPSLAGRRADRGGGEDRGGGGDAHHHRYLALAAGLPEHQAAADEANAGDGTGQRVRRAVGGDDPYHAGAGADQREDAIAGRCAAQVALEAERVGEGHRDREVPGIHPAAR